VAGILVGESPILTRHIDEQLRGLIVALFMPIFFGLSGLYADLTVLADPELFWLTIGLVLIASVGKFSGAFVGGRLGGLTYAESLALACGMNARGSTEVIVASIGLTMGVLSQNLFTMIVTMAIVTTMAMPPMLRWALKRLPLSQDERQRLEREELDAKGFVTNLERLLLAVDDSANGSFAARLAGVIAGSGGKPITILDMARKEPDKQNAKAKTAASGNGGDGKSKSEAAKQDAKDSKSKPQDPEKHDKSSKPKTTESEQEVKAAAESVTTLEQDAAVKRPPSIDIRTRPTGAEGPEAVAKEARKGYGLLVVGIDKIRGPKGGFSKEVTRIAEGFDGPLAVVVARGSHPARVFERRSRILIPVNGTDVSSRAAEVALTLAHANNSQVTALFVTRSGASASRSRRPSRLSASRRNEEAVLKAIAELADRYEVNVRTAMRVNVAPDEAILKEAKRGRYDLIVLGVARRSGDTLFFGNTAAAVLDNSEISTLFVAS
jgi:nucleotide-binding universal stress UspA family protein